MIVLNCQKIYTILWQLCRWAYLTTANRRLTPYLSLFLHNFHFVCIVKRDFTIEFQASLKGVHYWLKIFPLFHDWLKSLNLK